MTATVVRHVPRHPAAAVSDLMVDGAGRTVRTHGAGVVARRATDDARLDVGDECWVLLLMTRRISVEHLAECSWIVNIITAQIAIRPMTPFPTSVATT